MATKHKQGFCKDCEKLVPVTSPGTNHILHLLLSIITAGIWVIIWILAAISSGPWRCSICGGKKISNVS